MNRKKWENQRQRNAGFTLVELIVVLVILAILAAISVPALLGYIDRAKASNIIVEARQMYTDAEVALIDFYAKNDEVYSVYYAVNHSGGRNAGYTDYDGVFHPACCITQSSLSTIQQIYRQKGATGLNEHLNSYYQSYQEGSNSAAFSYSAHKISANILIQMDALDQKTSEYQFHMNTRASETTYDDYYNTKPASAEKSNPLIYQLYFDERGKIVMFEYGKDGYLIRFENGKTYVEKNGKTYKSH